MKCKIFVSSLLLQLLLIACQKETIPIAANVDCNTITYSATIEPMVRQSCGGSSCHGNGAPDGDMMTYTKLKPYINDGSFKKEVLDNQTMPEGGNMTSQELGQIKCWMDGGSLNN